MTKPISHPYKQKMIERLTGSGAEIVTTARAVIRFAFRVHPERVAHAPTESKRTRRASQRAAP